MGDLFEPYDRLIPIYVISKRYEVPENNSILRCFQYLNTQSISYGKFCWNGECENCRIHHLPLAEPAGAAHSAQFKVTGRLGPWPS